MTKSDMEAVEAALELAFNRLEAAAKCFRANDLKGLADNVDLDIRDIRALLEERGEKGNSAPAGAAPFDPMRRRDLQRMTPLEQNIRHLVLEVEKLGADERLTDCVVLLGQAQDRLSDFIDGARPHPTGREDGQVADIPALRAAVHSLDAMADTGDMLWIDSVPDFMDALDELERLRTALSHPAGKGGE